MIWQLKHFIACTMSVVSPELCSRVLYYRKFGRPIDLKTPKTLNEKIMWLKLNTYRDDPLVTQCADKYRVREYVEQAGCGDALNTLYGVWDSPRPIDWSALPDAFVLKCNHGCGYNILCPDKRKLDTKAAVRQLEKWLRTSFWLSYAELQYRKIPRKVICEKLLGGGGPLPDYKVYCFHGKAEYILVCLDRGGGRKPKFYFFDRDWNFCPITRDGKQAAKDFSLPRPQQLDKMLAYAERLSEPFPFVRADFYDDGGRIVFGELTFTPAAALDTGRLPETDRMFGAMLDIETLK